MSKVEEIVEEDDVSNANNLGDVGNDENPLIKRIPLRNKFREIIYYFTIDAKDYEKVSKYTWSVTVRKQVNGLYKAVHGKVNGKDIPLSHFLCGKPKNGYVIDHIDNDGLNNIRDNLHKITHKGNSQNRKKIITDKTTSQYLGVHFKKKYKRWYAYSSDKFLGSFDNEIDAAIQYDKYTLIEHGEKASTNSLVQYQEIVSLTINDIVPLKEERTLPKNITKPEEGKFHARIGYNNKTYSSKYYNTIEEALKKLEDFKNIIKLIKEDELKKHLSKEITRNDEGFAIINIYDKDKKLKGYTIVDDGKWHELSNCAIYYKEEYINIYLKENNNTKKRMSLHRYLMNDPEGMIVDHINNNPEDNRISNLRVLIDNQNNYNTIKRENCSSIYKGVFYKYKKRSKTYYQTEIAKDHKKYTLGCYEIEIQAALAYNLMAKILFKEFANINILNIDNDLCNKYKNEILEKWSKMPKLVGVI